MYAKGRLINSKKQDNEESNRKNPNDNSEDNRLLIEDAIAYISGGVRTAKKEHSGEYSDIGYKWKISIKDIYEKWKRKSHNPHRNHRVFKRMLSVARNPAHFTGGT